jgi:putative acetyltransferase
LHKENGGSEGNFKSFDISLDMQPAFESVQLIELAHNPYLLSQVKELLAEYGNYMYNDLRLTDGKDIFYNDLEHFPTAGYLPPAGTFIAAISADEIAGCIGIKKFNSDNCEMKRMYIRPRFRGKGTGKLFFLYVSDWCRRAGYKSILLDTNAEMHEAVSLYHSCGFKEIPPYCINKNDHPLYMEYVL